MKIHSVSVLALLSAAIIAALAAAPVVAADEPKAKLVKSFVDIFSQHDLTGLLALTHAEVEWLTIDGSSVLVETRGQEALAASLRKYFEGCPTCRSTVDVSSVNGNFVSAIETAHWQSKGKERAQASLSVYEILDGKVRRVWYYPAVAK